MYLKLIFWILFLLIFVNISIERNCKCPKNGGNILYKRRYKRGNRFCSCLRGGGGSRMEHSEGSDHGGTRSSGRISHGSGRSELEVTGSQSHEGGSDQEIVQESGGYYGHGGQSYGAHDYGEQSHWGPSYEGTSNVSGFGGYFGESSGGIHEEGRKKILFICDNYFYSHLKLNVNYTYFFINNCPIIVLKK